LYSMLICCRFFWGKPYLLKVAPSAVYRDESFSKFSMVKLLYRSRHVASGEGNFAKCRGQIGQQAWIDLSPSGAVSDSMGSKLLAVWWAGARPNLVGRFPLITRDPEKDFLDWDKRSSECRCVDLFDNMGLGKQLPWFNSVKLVSVESLSAV